VGNVLFVGVIGMGISKVSKHNRSQVGGFGNSCDNFNNINYTPEKERMSPKKAPFRKLKIVFQPSFFNGHVSLSEESIEMLVPSHVNKNR